MIFSCKITVSGLSGPQTPNAQFENGEVISYTSKGQLSSTITVCPDFAYPLNITHVKLGLSDRVSEFWHFQS